VNKTTDDWAYLDEPPASAFLKRDADGKLHCATGPAALFASDEAGFVLYAIHGVRVPERWIIDPQTLTPADVENEESEAVRQAGFSLLAELGKAN
jgi:hypothetical protein